MFEIIESPVSDVARHRQDAAELLPLMPSLARLSARAQALGSVQ